MFRPGQNPQTSGSVLDQPQQSTAGTDRLSYGEQLGQIGAFPFPLEAIVDATGERVTLLNPCNWATHSPSAIGLDRRGKLLVAAFEEVTITDARVIPNLNADDLRRQKTPPAVYQGTMTR